MAEPRGQRKLLSEPLSEGTVGNISWGCSVPISPRFLTKPVVAFTITFLLMPLAAAWADDPALTREQMKQFLETAAIVGTKGSDKGVTHPWRLTLSNGTISHDASFQAIDEHKNQMTHSNGQLEFNFVDSYKYNIAAYRLAELLGVEDMLPVYVERKWKGQVGSLSWWLPVKMDEADRAQKHLLAPDTDRWNKQMYRVRVFDELVYDTDANLTNVLIGEDWTIWRVDFTRAFRGIKDIHSTKNLVKCDRQLFEKIKALKADEVAEKTKNYLTKDEVKALMARRDKIVAAFQNMIAQKGEADVLYEFAGQ